MPMPSASVTGMPSGVTLAIYSVLCHNSRGLKLLAVKIWIHRGESVILILGLLPLVLSKASAIVTMEAVPQLVARRYVRVSRIVVLI